MTCADAVDRPDPLADLLRASHLLAPDQLATAVTEHARGLGAQEAVVYLADYEQLLLVPLQGPGVPARQELTVDGSLAGLAFRRVQPLHLPTSEDAATSMEGRLWVPLLDGTARLGVVEFSAPVISAELEDRAGIFAALVAELLVSADAYSDLFARLRRRKTLSLAAEIQWELLPPLTCATDRVVVSGLLEPAYDIGGDSFDYAVNGPVVDLLVCDAVGHGLASALLASAAVGTYRHARRDAADLPDLAAAVDAMIAGQFPDSRFVTAVLARLDLDTGELRWINAGHPAPLIIRDGTLVHPPPCPPARPLGLLASKPGTCGVRLRPGDRVIFYTDGITEARSPDGQFFGEQRLADFVIRADSAGDTGPETLRRLVRSVLEHQADQLQDDASIVLLEWRTGQEGRLEV